MAGVRSRIHMPAMRYSMVSSWLVRPISSANIAKQLLSRAAACTQFNDSEKTFACADTLSVEVCRLLTLSV